MKKVLFATVAVVVVAGAAGGWYVLHSRDPMQQAKVALSKGDFRSAGLDLRTAVRDNPGNAEAHALLAQLLLTSDDAIAAEREIKRAMELSWDRSLSLATLGQAYLRQGKWKEILSEIPEHGANNDQTAYFLMVRAIAQHEIGDKSVAGETIKQALTLAPQNAEVHLAAARLSLQDGRREDAITEADRAITLDPQRIDAYQLKAVTQMAGGHRDDALATLDQAVQIAPTRDDVRAQRASVLVMANDNDRARVDVDELMKRSDPAPLAKYMKVILLTREKKYSDADALIQQIDRWLPELPRGLYFKALVKQETGQVAQAEDAITQFVNRNPDDGDAVRLLAAIEITANHPDRAIPYLVKAVGRGINDSQTLQVLGQAYSRDGKQTEAQRAFDQAAQVSTAPEQLTRLASARLQVGDLSGAVGDLKRAADASPNQTGAREALISTSLRLGQLDRAQEELDALRRDVGDTEAVGVLTGLLNLARLDPDAAEQAFAETARKFPNSVVARINDARLLIQLRRFDQALTVLTEMLDKDPTRADALTLAVQALVALNRPQDAVDLAERARKAKPDDLGIINGEAQLLGRMRQFDRAIEIIQSSKVSGKVPSQLLATLGSLQFAAGQADAAKQSFAALVAAEPSNPLAALAQADALVQLKDFAGARSAMDQAIQRQAGSLPLLQARVRLDLVDGGVDQALQTADRLRNDPANMPASALLKGGVLMGAGRFQDAVNAYETEYKRTETAALAAALAEAKQATGDLPGAIGVLSAFQNGHSEDPVAALGLATMQIVSRQFDAAQRNLELVLRQQPTNVTALNNLAWVLQQKNDKRAREIAQRAFEISPTPEVTDTLGWILVDQGDSKRAVGLLQGAATAAPNNLVIRYHLAVALKDVGRTREAIDVLKPVAESPLTFDEKGKAQSLLAELSKTGP